MRALIFSCLALSLFSCANIGTLGGGKEDDKAPEVVGSNITQTNFNQRKIHLEFNEYITLNNPENNITLQPKHTTLKFAVIKKKLVISLDSSLKPNTTYNLIIDKGVMDNNANNPFSYSTTFSTGNSIDTGTISISLKEYKELKNLKLALSLNDGSDSFVNFHAHYLLDANRDIITFRGLNETPYNAWLFTDNNNDLKPDLYQPINFIKTPQTDSIYTLEPRHWQAPFKITKAITDTKFIKLKYNPSQQYKANLDKYFNTIQPVYLYVTTDSALMMASADILRHIQVPLDTIPYIDGQKEVRSLVIQSINIIKIKNDYHISVLKPPYYQYAAGEKEITGMRTRTLDSFIWLPNKQISSSPDTFRLQKISWKDYKSLAILSLSIKNSNHELYDIIILKDNKEYLRINETDQFEKYLEPGTYKIRIYENSKKHIFDPFKMSPAPQKLYEREITLKANWDEVLTINL